MVRMSAAGIPLAVTLIASLPAPLSMNVEASTELMVIVSAAVLVLIVIPVTELSGR